MKGHLRSQAGFTIFEMVVTVGIIGVLSLLVGAGLPVARDNQRVMSTEQQLQDMLRLALQRATHEVRPELCTNDSRVGGDDALARRCSNVGVALTGTTAVMFADLNADRRYTAASDLTFEERDLTAEADQQAFVFEASPPTVALYANSRPVTVNQPGRVVISSGRQARAVQVLPFGQVEVVAGSSN